MTAAEKLAFLMQQYGQDEATVIARAVEAGVDIMYKREMESAYLRGELPRDQAYAILGYGRVEELDYAVEAALEDVEWGLAGDEPPAPCSRP